MGSGRVDQRVPQPGGAASSQQEGRRHLKQLEDAWMKVKAEKRSGDQECRDALKALEEAKKEAVEAVKKTEAVHRLLVDTKRGEDRRRRD